MKTMSQNLKDLFLLDPSITYLNHGSFGACPRPVFEVYQTWQRELECHPVEFLGRRITTLLGEARQALASFLGVEADEVVYFSNPTTAINMIARALHLEPGDEILTSDHEYGAMDRTWRFLSKKRGWSYLQQPIPVPVTTPEAFLERMWSGVTPRTRVIYISHITSPTALKFPIEELCRRARQAGLLTIVDGAHAPGQIPLNLAEIDADLYAGACHKWLCAPKGAGFLYARKEVQAWLEPLVVSWGFESEFPSGSQFVDYHEWQGTRDMAAILSVPAAIAFQKEHDWEQVRRECHQLAVATRQRINELTGLEPLCPETPDAEGFTWFAQMFGARLPEYFDLDVVKTELYDRYRIEVPLLPWQAEKLIRVSIQAYNDSEDADALLEALGQLMRKTFRS